MRQRSDSWIRFLVVAALLVGAGVFLHARGRTENLPLRKDLVSFPKQADGWVGTEVAIQQGILETLGAGEFLVRIYRRTPEEPHIDFFLAYFPTQRTGSTIHSPKNCLPGAGWAPISSGRIQLTRAGGEASPVNRYVITKGLDRQLVLYWYQAHGRVVASEYWAKFYLVADSIRMNRSDGALVRVVTPISRQEDTRAAENRAVGFAQQILPLLDNYIPR